MTPNRRLWYGRFTTAASHSSVRIIKKELEGQSILSAKGGTIWSESAIRNILKNEKYCGDMLIKLGKDTIQGAKQTTSLCPKADIPSSGNAGMLSDLFFAYTNHFC